MTAYQQEVLSGFDELVAEAGTKVTFDGDVTATGYDALIIFPSTADEARAAGEQLTAHTGVEMRRTDFLAANVGRNSRFTLAGESYLLQVDAIEDDGVQSVVYFSASEVE